MVNALIEPERSDFEHNDTPNHSTEANPTPPRSTYKKVTRRLCLSHNAPIKIWSIVSARSYIWQGRKYSHRVPEIPARRSPERFEGAFR